MIDKIVKSYYNFFDKQIKDSSVVVLIISLFVLSVGLFIPDRDILNFSKSNILELKNKNEIENIININGKKYKIIFEEIE